MSELTPKLSREQVEDFARRMPEVIRAALENRSLTGLDVSLVRVRFAELCYPLTQEQVQRVRILRTFTRKDVDVVHLPNSWDEQDGLLTFRVRYDMAGYDADGNAVTVQEEGVIGLLCGSFTGSGEDRTMFISDVEKCTMNKDGSVRRPGLMQRRMSLVRRRREQNGRGGTIGEVVWGVLEVVFEIVVDIFSDV